MIRAWLALRRNDISGKTGTTNDERDTWFNGFNRNIVTSVWVGFDDDQPLGAGEQGAAPRCRSGSRSCARRCARNPISRGRCRRDW